MSGFPTTRRSALLAARSPDADERRRAAEAFLGVFGVSEHTYAALYRGVLERDWFVAQARGFGDTLQAKLFTHAIPPQVVHTLLEVTRAGTAPLQRYFRLRRRLLGPVRFVPLVSPLLDDPRNRVEFD